jgi:anti-anti-sigma regulatory factor
MVSSPVSKKMRTVSINVELDDYLVIHWREGLPNTVIQSSVDR